MGPNEKTIEENLKSNVFIHVFSLTENVFLQGVQNRIQKNYPILTVPIAVITNVRKEYIFGTEKKIVIIFNTLYKNKTVMGSAKT